MQYAELVSIIILSYKNLSYIKETIDSILIQTYQNIELIIADDGTADFDPLIYRNYIKSNNKGNIKNIKVYSNQKNVGIVKNINVAIKSSNGKYIKTIAADDKLYSEEVIEVLVDCMQKQKVDIVSSNMLFCDDEMNVLKEMNDSIPLNKAIKDSAGDTKKLFRLLSIQNDIPAPTMIIKRDLFEKYGYYDEDYKLLEDWPMWLRLARNDIGIYYKDIISVKYRYGVGVSNTPNPIYLEDISKCYEKEILPYKKQLGVKVYRNIKWNYILNYKISGFSKIQKINFKLLNIDFVIKGKIDRLISKKQ